MNKNNTFSPETRELLIALLAGLACGVVLGLIYDAFTSNDDNANKKEV